MKEQEPRRALNAPAAQVDKVGMARRLYLATGILGVAITFWSGAADAQNMGPCMQIRAACEQAGFVQGGAREGTGLYVDCVRPITLGLQQPPRASIPFPAIDPQVIAACRARNPNFAGPMGPRNPAISERPSMGPAPSPGEPTEPEQRPGSERPSTPQGLQAPAGPNANRNIVVVLTADLASGAVSCRSPRP
jgi:hypothetical protein